MKYWPCNMFYTNNKHCCDIIDFDRLFVPRHQPELRRSFGDIINNFNNSI